MFFDLKGNCIDLSCLCFKANQSVAKRKFEKPAHHFPKKIKTNE
jgi:hypothetical protein